MSVYIDNEMSCLPKGRYRWNTVTHLFADTLDELHAFAAKIGMRREWFQHKPGGLPHYDLNDTRRQMAFSHGAILLMDRRVIVNKWQEITRATR